MRFIVTFFKNINLANSCIFNHCMSHMLWLVAFMFLKHFIINSSSFNVCTKFCSNWSPKEESTIMIIHYVLNSKTGIFPVSKQYFCLGHFLSLSHTSCSDLVITSHRIISCFIFKVNFLLCLVSVLLSCFHLLMGFTCTLLPSC